MDEELDIFVAGPGERFNIHDRGLLRQWAADHTLSPDLVTRAFEELGAWGTGPVLRACRLAVWWLNYCRNRRNEE